MKEKKTPLKTLETELRKIHKTCRAVDQKAEKNVQLWTIYIDCLLANIPGEEHSDDSKRGMPSKNRNHSKIL